MKRTTGSSWVHPRAVRASEREIARDCFKYTPFGITRQVFLLEKSHRACLSPSVFAMQACAQETYLWKKTGKSSRPCLSARKIIVTQKIASTERDNYRFGGKWQCHQGLSWGKVYMDYFCPKFHNFSDLVHLLIIPPRICNSKTYMHWWHIPI